MFNLLFKKQKNKLWRFRGGIYPPEMKQVTSDIPLRSLPLPNLLIIPLQQHLGACGELSVQVDQYVLKGEPLTRGFGRALPVHAPTSGIISDISPQVTAHPSGLATMAISLIPDHKDIWCTRHPIADFTRVSREQLFAVIEQAGIAGLGGAGFPSATKLQHAQQIHTLIINAAECEPCITADDRLMQEYADEIIIGCEILRHLLQPQQVFIGIEDNKPQAITALKQALEGHSPLQLRIIPTKYPSGSARQLIKILTGMEIPIGQHSVFIGVLMQNIATVYAIKRAIMDGEPLIERVVTLTGELIRYPGNVWARIGTPVKYLLEAGGWITQAASHLVIMGGPLTGFTLPHVNVPIIKTSNAIVTATSNEFVPPGQEQACIRCAQCADVCPAGLLPQQLYWFSRGQQHEKARQYHLFDCIECGACAYVCPSRIPLVHYYRQQKAIIREQDQEKIRATEAKQRFEARQARLSKEKQAREQHHQQAVRQPSAQHQYGVQAATARIEQRQHAGEIVGSFSTVAHSPKNLVAYRTKTEKLLPLQKAFMKNEAVSSTPSFVTPSPMDPRKATVAAAIARAKARKAQQQLEYQSKLLKSPRLHFDDQQNRTQAFKDNTLSNQEQNNTHLSLTDHEE